MIHRSRYPDVAIPDVSLPDYVFGRADEWRDHPALVDGPSGRTLTFRDLRALIRRVAGGLSDRGFRKGDVLCIYSPNLPE
ncbi:MAG: AMP-binding protein, partial [Gemmatimonadales bacterium]